MRKYPYGIGDKLADRNTYFYSQYIGFEIFPAWKEQRQAAVNTPSICEVSKRENSDVEKSHTEILISDLKANLSFADVQDSEWVLVDKLLQRFEVAKRIYGTYSADWRPENINDYKSLGPYLEFAELMDIAYCASKKLQYLNALLKVLDTITSESFHPNQGQRKRMIYLAEVERRHIEKLANKLGIIL